MSVDVVILGRIGYDLYSEEPHVPLPQVRRFSRYLGGSSANMAVGLSRLGAQVGMVSSLGDDSLSHFLIDFLQAERVDTSHVQTAPGFLPSLCLTEVSPPDRFPQVFYRRDPVDTMLDVTGDDLDYVTSGSMFVTNGTTLCASPSRESAYRAMERAKNAGCRVVLDVDYRSMSWRKPEEAGLAVRLALPFVDVLIGNQLELRLVSGVNDLDQATAKLQQSGVPMLVSKLGELGTRVLTGGDSVVPAAVFRGSVHHHRGWRRLCLGISLCHAERASGSRMPPLRKRGGGNRCKPPELLGSYAVTLGS